MIKLAQFLLYTIRLMQEHKIKTGRTPIHKIIYFSLTPELRKQLFIPYLFGPFSEIVQTSLYVFCKKGILQYNSAKKEYHLKKKTPVQIEGETANLVEREKKVIEFLKAHNLTTTKKISDLAKVHLFLSHLNGRQMNKDEIASYIKIQSQFMGWESLHRRHKDEIINLMHYSEELEKRLKDVSLRGIQHKG